MIDPKVVTAVSPLGLASLIISSVIVPTVAWLVKSGTKLLKKSTLLESRVRDLRVMVEGLTSTSHTCETRLNKLEDAMCEFRAASQRVDEQFAAVMQELKLLPRVTTMLETFSVAIAHIVPRTEVDSRIKDVQHRLELVEQDVRKAGRS